ncbi:MAG: asparagine synthase C-terminal domain-containing protein, partial [Verrucomicrobiota bacterium]
LSGDGGDELFGGYPRYDLVHRLWKIMKPMPTPLRGLTGRVLRSIPGGQKTSLYGRPGPLNDKLKKLAELVTEDSSTGLYRHSTRHGRAEDILLSPGADEESPAFLSNLPSVYHQAMAFDLMGYLPDDILTKVDRASMSVGLEVRVPLLDHGIVEFAWGLPLTMRRSKQILKRILGRYLPASCIDRPKQGFAIPVGAWLRGPLRDWAEDLLDETHLRNQGLFQSAAIRQTWTEHLNGTRNWPARLWDILMFQTWWKEQKR